MLDVIVLVPDHCLSIYFSCLADAIAAASICTMIRNVHQGNNS